MGFETERLEEEAPMTMGFKTNEASSSSDALKIPREDDPFLGQNLQHLSSPLKTFANVFMSLVSVGVLGLPYTFKKTGWRKLESQSEAVKISSFSDLRFAVCGSVGRIVVDAMGNSENGNSTRPLLLHPVNTVPQQPNSTIQKNDFRFNQI
ncbi:Amino acid transporter ANTL2 [Capsicum chinense]|nr:Amino acid transporter ANTL2 [Capsicum chinense]